MHGSNSTRAGVGVYAKRLTEVLGEEQVTAIARRSGWLRRVRKVMPPNRTLNRWRGQGFSRREFSFFRFGVSWVLRIQWTFPFSALEGAGAR